MKRIALISIAAIIVYYAIFGFPKSELPRLTLIATEQGNEVEVADSCESKVRCIIVYVAPWCSYCHSAQPFIRELRKMSDESSYVGMKIIVGWDVEDKLRDTAKEIGGIVYIDPGSKFRNALSLHGVPTWLVVDNKGHIYRQFMNGGITSTAGVHHAAQWFIENELELNTFFE